MPREVLPGPSTAQAATGRDLNGWPEIAVALPFWRDRPAFEPLEVAIVADQHRVPEIWIGETNVADAFALAGAIGSQTITGRLIVGPLALGVRTPVTLAMGLAAVAGVTERAVGLALGSSSPQIVEGWHGVRRQRSITLMSETVACLRSLLRGEQSDFEGKTVRSNGFRLRRPPQDVTIELAASGPRMLALAGEIGDGVVANMISPQQVSAVRSAARLDDGSGTHRRARLSVWVQAALDPTESELAAFKRDLAIYLAAPGYAERFAELGHADLIEFARTRPGLPEVAGRIPDELVSAVAILGDESAIVDAVLRYRAAGADTVVIQPVTHGDTQARGILRTVGEIVTGTAS